MLGSEGSLIRVALALGAADVGGPLSDAEREMARRAGETSAPAPSSLAKIKAAIRDGADPLGEAFCTLRIAATRRTDGAIYTPGQLVEPMVEWTLDQKPARVIDTGVGSGRFLAAVLHKQQAVEAIAVDTDPVATLMTRAMLATIGAQTVRVLNADYTRLEVPAIEGRSAFIGNPPYVRHHQLSADTKAWAQRAAASLGHRISGLAGLHAYFFLATALLGRPGDVGCFVTSAEWLDVNYGAIMRALVLGQLGGQSLHIVEPKALPFQGTQTTAVITALEIGTQADSIRIQDVESLPQLKDLASTGRPVARERLTEEPRWSGLLRSGAKTPDGYIELGELCRVHRGAVTGANATWVLRHRADLPDSVLFPSVTKARELFAAGSVLDDPSRLRLVVDIPSDLDRFDPDERSRVGRFIQAAKRAGVDKGYIAAHRRAWWSVGLQDPAPILATYMARRPPTFVMNAVDARHINIAHGLYPRQPLDGRTLSRLAEALRASSGAATGRVYAGGLIKFEPKEMERLLIPDLTILTGDEPFTPALDARRV
jgi:adenine-specific DNA-methyltransferase